MLAIGLDEQGNLSAGFGVYRNKLSMTAHGLVINRIPQIQRYMEAILDKTELQDHAPQHAFPAFTARVWNWPFDLLLAVRLPPVARLERWTPLSQPAPAWIATRPRRST